MLRQNSYKALTAARFNSSTSPITQYSYIQEYLSDASKEEVAKYLKNLGPFPTYSNILNPQHFFQNAVLLEYSKKQPHPVSLRQLAGYGNTLTRQKVINSANFVRIELPIRLALRIRDLQTLPFGVVNNFHLAQIYESYYHSFNAFRKIPKIHTIEDNNKFCEMMSSMLDDHIFNLSHLMMGALEVAISNNLPEAELNQIIHKMLSSRISRRLIIEQHLSISQSYNKKPYDKKPPHYLGEIFDDCNAVEQLKIVAGMIKDSMKSSYPEIERMPDLEIEGDVKTHFPFIVPHLQYILHEILRNSFEATIRTHSTKTSKLLPPVKVTIVDSTKQVLFRISDQGGGISHDKLKSIWSFGKKPDLARKSLANFHRIPGLQLYSNLKVTPSGSSIVTPQAQQILQNTSLGESTGSKKKSTLENLMGRPHHYHLGMGLPISAIYAEYWNGELTMNSLEGYGSDTSLALGKVGYHSNIIQLDRA
ncbi:conserved hypothetical protein [Candida tropicalis MYA-3404]|uniref:Protein-serine/threonine kinase n=1 Tax=Candida tropicalis (strain ATCC MYA-3404 / T1) TaxID=294747 RepID=C5MC72_CANTT|nr:conserved hypothetical protein [Candida tropicalis MYA-3404]XP_002549376.1 conserved hypothetical protein [Candida tropicalis MYA-3404]KAG4407070.1 hypothetical protein JTP64_004454 [Candida tropicalis]EER33239.1 conserved hypothetical protein [Candida tropicalis MYA-3404]EER33248.1 conserved hypothetical protein [Candida tropicalis MYA-3404]KAG4407079.1 hypothetical protein JTP64_004463 [Candida tropicalis]